MKVVLISLLYFHISDHNHLIFYSPDSTTLFTKTFISFSISRKSEKMPTACPRKNGKGTWASVIKWGVWEAAFSFQTLGSRRRRANYSKRKVFYLTWNGIQLPCISVGIISFLITSNIFVQLLYYKTNKVKVSSLYWYETSEFYLYWLESVHRYVEDFCWQGSLLGLSLCAKM